MRNQLSFKLKLVRQAMLYFYFASLGSSQGLANEVISLAVNQEHLVELPVANSHIDFDQPELMQVRKLGNKRSLIFTAKKTGRALVTIFLNDGTTRTFTFQIGDQLSELEKVVKKLPGITSSRSNGRITLVGIPGNKETSIKIQELKLKYGELIEDQTDGNLVGNNTIVRTINRVLRENDLANFAANSYGRIITLEGSPKNAAQHDLALRIARMIHPEIENRVSVDSNGGAAISIEVLFIEVSKTNAQTIGFDVSPSNSTTLKPETAAFAQANLTGVAKSHHSGATHLNWQVGGLASFLQLVQERHNGRVLSQPKLIARSGTDAKFHAGETVYISQKRKVDNEILTEYMPVDTGILLNITPKIDEIGQIDSKITTEISQILDGSLERMPKLTKSRVDTAVTILDGQTILLSGLTRKRNTKTVERVPLLADIPVVGELFKNRTFNDAEGELIVLVTMNRIKAFDQRAKAAGQMLWDESEPDISFRFND